MPVLTPNSGLFLDRPPIAIPPGGLSDGQNFRIKNKTLTNRNLGWSLLSTEWAPSAPVSLIDTFTDRDNVATLLIATTEDIYRYDDATDAIFYINPIYATGAATSGGTTVEFSGGTDLVTAGIVAGEYISFGSATEDDPTATWYEIASITDLDTLELTTSAPVNLGVDFTIRRLFTGTIDDHWRAVTFLHEADGDEDWWIATNGVDDVVYWTGAGPLTSMGLSFKASSIAYYKNMLICAGIEDSGETLPGQVRNSDIGNPDQFSAGLSEIFTVHGNSDKIDNMLPLGDSLVLYSTNHVITMDFVGDPFVFIFRTANAAQGPIGPDLVANHTNYHAFIGTDTGYLFDGVTFEEFGNHVLREVLRQRDPLRITRGFHHFDDENGDLIWAIPLTTDGTEAPAKAWVEHYLEGDNRPGGFTPFSTRDFPFTTGGHFARQNLQTWDLQLSTWEDSNYRWNDVFFVEAFPMSLLGDYAGHIWVLNSSQEANNVALPSYVRFGRQPTVDGRMRGLVTRVYAFSGEFPGSTMMVRTRLADNANGPVAEVDEQEFPLDFGEGQHFASVFRRARYIEMEFGSDGSAWSLAGYDLDIRPGGMR